MRRSAAPSFRAAKRGKFVSPLLGSQPRKPTEDLTTTKGLDLRQNEQEQTSSDVKGSSMCNETLQENVNPSTLKAKQSKPFSSPFIMRKSSPLSPGNLIGKSNGQESIYHYHSVVWGKMSKKKHKKWDGDGILMTKGRTAILKDLDGKEIGRGSGYKTSELESLEEGHTLFVGGKEIEIMGKVSTDDYMSGKCFHATETIPINTIQDKSSNTKVFKPFNNPGRPGSSPSAVSTNQKTNRSPAVVLIPRHSTDAPGALVMPRPCAAHQWDNNKESTQMVDVVVDPHLAQHLRPHQREGVIFLYECVLGLRNFNGNGAILGDEMGLGKTLQCISLIWTLHKQNPYGGQPLCRRTLLITPGSLVKNWCCEFNKWLGNERIKVYPVTSDKRVKEFAVSPIYPVLVISYEMFVRSLDEIKEIKFDLVVCDEAHRLKNSTIKTNMLISGLKTSRRVLLTGTPIQNDLKEFHSLIELCNPGVLGTQVLFRRVYEQPIVQGQQPNATSEDKSLGQTRAAELNRLTSLFFLRRTAEINNKYLPPKVDSVVFCRPSQLQLSLYRHLLTSRLVRSCLTDSSGGSRHLVCIAALKKLCNHPSLIYQASREAQVGHREVEEETLYDGLLSVFPGGYDSQGLMVEQSGKLETLSKMLAGVFSLNERVVVVSSYTQTLDLIQKLCESREYRFVRLDGTTATSKRQSIVDRFNARHSTDVVFLLSSKAGGVGLNLIGASRLILYDIDWNPANDLQAMARVWRDGQKRKVFIYRLLTTGTIEEKIYQRQTTKLSLSGAVADAKNESKVEFSIEDIKDLFRLHENTLCATHDLLQCRCTEIQTGTSEHVTDPQPIAASVRACQLGVSSVSQKKHTSIAELMEWQHLPFPVSDADIQDETLRSANNLITFMFRSETNTARLP